MMKKYVLFVLLSTVINYTLMAQESHAEQWTQLKSFEKEGKPKSAMGVVTTIYDQAKKEGNNNQMIKALLYKAKYMLQLEEDAQLTIIKEFKEASAANTFPTKNILESILANMYWQYFQQHRWQFYNRSKTTEKVDQEDFRSWDLQTLFEEVHFHYQNSLQNGVLAQQTVLSDFDELLHIGYNSKQYRPTLYDFLNHNALAFYKTSETNITKPSYAFEISDPIYLKESKVFSRIPIATKDSLSLQFHALKIYQNLIKFHAKDGTPEALVNVNIERLHYVKANATFADVNTVVLQTLEAEREKYIGNRAAALYDYEIANLYKQQGDAYVPTTNETPRWDLKKAVEICTAAFQKHPKSRGAKNCKALKEQIVVPELAITTEKIIPVQTAGRLLFTYKNLDTIHFKALAVSQKQLKALSELYREKEIVAFLNALPVQKTWNSKLCNEYDYQRHTTEVVIPELESGTYIVVAAPTEELSHERLFAYGNFQISNLTLIENNTPEHLKFQVVDRITGAPIANARIQLKSEYYNDHRKLNTTLTTNEKGEASFKAKTYYYNVSITITHQKDKVYLKGYRINESYAPRTAVPQERQTTFLFTDRSIYRPGQTIYFKGIVMSSINNTKHSVVPNQSVSSTLIDVNGQSVKTLNFKTNAYGSFHGEFILPATGLTGQYSIRTNNYQNVSFSVEEYKRPKFETHFNPVTETYAVNDTIQLKGVATAYAGSMITEAKVVYRVQRQVNYPRWCYWYYNNNNSTQEITQGETITNEKGEYVIPFAALPDPKAQKENLPVFSYVVTADVIDINGETHSTTATVQVGYHTSTAEILMKGQLNIDSKDPKFSIVTKNLNGQAIAAKGTVTIHKLKGPQYPMRKRPWNAPDYAGFTKDEFKKLYPHDAYQNEDDYRQWKNGKQVYRSDFKTTTDGDLKGVQEVSLGTIKKWEHGYYKVELQSVDSRGMPLKDIHYVAVIDPKAKQISDQQLFQITTDKSSYVVGDQVALNVQSASQDMTVVIEIEKNHKIVKTQLVRLSNTSKTIVIPVNADDLGGFSVHYSFVNYNSYRIGSINIAVPYESTALSIVTKTFRDKLQPGQEETWSFTIKGPKGDKVAAEMLASMYDASLDQFRVHDWSFNPIYQPSYSTRTSRNANRSFGTDVFRVEAIGSHYGFDFPSYDSLNWFDFYFGRSTYYGGRQRRMSKSAPAPMAVSSGMDLEESAEMLMESPLGDSMDKKEMAVEKKLNKPKGKEDQDAETDVKEDTGLEGVTIRKNLQETAFFFPQLTTDDAGNVSFSFTAPEALTRWKLQLVAHTKTLNSATHSLEAVTQKELMVLPNPPRFLREGDAIIFSAKIASLATTDLKGIVELQLFDALTNIPIDAALQNSSKRQEFTVKANGNTNISWALQIPDTYQAVQYKIVAKAGEFSDGEQNVLPVLSNRMLVTETLPMWVRSNQTKTFTLEKLKANTSTTLKHHKLTLEMTSNPAWYAVQALPYLMEYPYECAEQTFSRYYANSLASHIASSNPRIQDVFNQWKSSDALLSNLEKNQELKSLMIQETPWLRDAQSETEQKKRIALLFDLNKMNAELQSAVRKLQQLQFGSGAFPWFKGGRENRYITQHIAAGFGHLKKLKVTTPDAKTNRMLQKAVRYLDQQFVKEYKELQRYCKKYKIDINDNHLSHTQVQYLYMRSFFPEIKSPNNTKEAKAYYLGQAKKYWLKNSLYSQGMLALILHRNADTTTATKIIRSLDEKSITNDELGMYWKSNTGGWYWYQAPIETQALMIEVFSEIEAEPKRTTLVDNLKIWLLKHKQTNRWSTTKSTSEAVYALLLQGSDWLSVTDMVDITLGTQKVDPRQMEEVKVEAGTGYFKTAWNGKEITPEMATATISKKGKGIAWGAVYWQYFENLDKITSAETPLSLRKKLFIKKNTDAGEEITAITKGTKLQLGDLVRVRIELRVDRAMEFVHMKDMRASGLEPINVISRYKWQDGLGYYESTKDASTNFFFDDLPKGVYVFEYDLRVNNQGIFSNGITMIQSMYAPEFSSHSEGVRIRVE